MKRRAGGNAHEKALRLAQKAGRFESLLGRDGDDAVVNSRIQHCGNKIGTDALQAVRTGLAAGQKRRISRLNSNNLNLGVEAFKVLTYTGNCSARTYSRNKNIYVSVGIIIYFRSCSFAVSL